MTGSRHVPLEDGDFHISFLDESTPANAAEALAPLPAEMPWRVRKVLIADDEEEIHKMTKLVLKGFVFNETRLEFHDTYSGRETIAFLEQNPDTAVVLLDVVMEEDDAGLKVVRRLREELKNSVTRIVLRTGQPGKAPEEKVVVEYEIDDYRSKTELTVQKLFSTMHVCLRAHRNLLAISQERNSLSQVLIASQDLFRYRSFSDFLNGMLRQVISLYDLDPDTALDGRGRDIDGLAFIQMMDSTKVLAATGRHVDRIGKPILLEECTPDLQELISVIHRSDESELVIRQGRYLGIYKRTCDQLIRSYIILESELNSENLDLIRLFLHNFSLAIDNFMLNMNMSETQREIVYRISEVVENRCDHTANHLRRVSTIVGILARDLGFADDEANDVSLASIMHDVGKIGIPDAILLKPGKLDPEEYECMKTHTSIGHGIFRDSRLAVLNLAADIALNHHERPDGSGYPNGLRAQEIPKASAIVAAADVFDALISDRVYKRKWPLPEVLDYFRANRGTQFSEEVVDSLLRCLPAVLEVLHSYPN